MITKVHFIRRLYPIGISGTDLNPAISPYYRTVPLHKSSSMCLSSAANNATEYPGKLYIPVFHRGNVNKNSPLNEHSYAPRVPFRSSDQRKAPQPLFSQKLYIPVFHRGNVNKNSPLNKQIPLYP
ncbi:unnamed protein product, partial [Sphacelaria rigidula]